MSERLKGKALPVIIASCMLLILDIVLAAYHLSHHGRGSAKTEFIMLPVLVLLVSLGLIAQQSKERSSRWKPIRWAVKSLLLIAVLLYAFLAIYHLTHQGLRSGLGEFGIDILLLFIAYCI